MKTAIIVALAVAAAVGRFFITPGDHSLAVGSYKAFAHLFEGWLFCYAYTCGNRLGKWLFWSLGVLEITMFAVSKM